MESHISQSVRMGLNGFPARGHLYRPVELARQSRTNCDRVYNGNGEVNCSNSRLPRDLVGTKHETEFVFEYAARPTRGMLDWVFDGSDFSHYSCR